MSIEPIYGCVDEKSIKSIDRPTREELKAILRWAGGRLNGKAETYMYLQHILQCARTEFFCSKTIGGCVLRTPGGQPMKSRKSTRLAKILGGRLVMPCNIHLRGAADAQGAGG